VETITTLGRQPFSRTKTPLLLTWGWQAFYHQLQHFSTTTDVCYSLRIASSCWQHSSMNIQFFSAEKSQSIRTQPAFHVFNLIVSIETLTNCDKEAGTKTKCFCQHWVNLVLPLKQPKGYSKNDSWCRVQVSCPVYCSMSSWHRDMNSTRP